MARFARRGKKYGLVDSRRRVVVPFIFDRIEPFYEGYGVGSIDFYGDYLFDQSGKVVFRQAFDHITRHGVVGGPDALCSPDAHYIITHKDESCLLDSQLRVLVPWGKYKIDWGPSEGIWVVRNQRCEYGYAGMGRVITPCLFANARSFHNGFAGVKWRGGKWGMIDARGNLVIPDIYDSICNASEGLVGTEREGRFGFLDFNGRVAIPFAFATVEEFHNGEASVQTEDGRWRTIDHAGKFVDELEKCEVPLGVREKYTPPKKAAQIGAAREKLRHWFDGLKGHVFQTNKKTEIGYLIHYAAPFTGSGMDFVAKGVKFRLRQKMRDDAWYCSIEGGDDGKRVFEKEIKLAGRRNPRLAGRCTGISFFLTERQLAGKDFSELVVNEGEGPQK